MSVKDFTRAGHFPTLIAALLYFDVSFMTWVMLGPLAPFLRDELERIIRRRRGTRDGSASLRFAFCILNFEFCIP